MLMDTNGHTILSEDYVSYEVAKLLKEKGFEGDINAYYHIWDYGNKVCSVQEFSHSEAPHLYIPAPTHQIAMKWLREVYGLFISIGCDDLNWNWQIFDIENRDENYDPICKSDSYGGISTYEQACDAALKYCLENLI